MHLRWALLFVGVVLLAAGTATDDARVWVCLPVVAFLAIPLLDGLLPLDGSAPASPAAARALRAVPILFAPAHLAVLVWSLVAHAGAPRATPLEDLAFVFAAGIAGGIAINVAHELMHRPTRLERGLAAALMTSVQYAHFCVEHVHGHHLRVATPDDPASSRLGEGLWHFLPRTLVGSLRSAWEIETRRGRTLLTHRVAMGLVAQGALLLLVGATLGPRGAALYLGQAAVAVLLLETINYIEHYGLTRARRVRADGREGWEGVTPGHSWNAEHLLAGSLLLQLPRHADHHAHAGRAFAELRHQPGAPQLPGSYPAMMLLALVPHLWFRVMDPRVAEHTRAREGRVPPG